jgi:hypothetical protein
MMDLIEWLKGLFADPTQQQKAERAKSTKVKQTPWLDSLYSSPLADSLYSAVGVPSFLNTFEPQKGLGQLYGEYDFGFDQVAMNRDRSKYDSTSSNAATQMLANDPRSVFIHEMGHKFKSGGKEFVPTNVLPFPSSYYMRDRPEGKASLALNEYYTKDQHEGAAQAFKNAWGFLAETAKDPKQDYRKLAGDMEGNTPGMGLIIQDLMKLPIFAKHPLQGQIFKEKKK